MRRARTQDVGGPLSALQDEYIYAPRMDWQQVLDDLRENGCTGYRVAKILGVNWSTVQHWRDSPKAELGYGLGRALLRLHAAFCGAGMTTRRHIEAEQSA